MMLKELDQYFQCVHVCNRDWIHPASFDCALYHIGASSRHHCAFKALRARRAPVIIHEHNCLSYYYETWEEMSLEEKYEFLEHVSARFARRFSDLADFQEFLDLRASPDRYGADVAIEALFIKRASILITHSPYVAGGLRRRYPRAVIRAIPFMVEPLSSAAGNRARRRLGLGPNEFLFGTFGFIGEYKRIEKILTAWCKWHNRPSWVKLLIVGQRQYNLAIPRSGDVIYLDYVKDEGEFDAYLAAADCAIQLRHPTLGETSAIISKLVANSKRLIASETPYTQAYARYDTVIRVPPDKNEVANLSSAYRRVIQLQRTPMRYDLAHAPSACVRRLINLIRRSDTV
jgi:glycosyltransferase involved in cell wall biosynthesis